MQAENIALRVRAFDPWPGAFASLKGVRMKITRVVAEASFESAAPGEVISSGKNGMVVACGKGALRVTELQPPGKRRMAAQAFLAGRPVSAGERFE